MDSKRKNIIIYYMCASYRTKLTLKFCSGLTIRTFPILGSHYNLPRLRGSNESYIPESHFLDHQLLASKFIGSEELFTRLNNSLMKYCVSICTRVCSVIQY